MTMRRIVTAAALCAGASLAFIGVEAAKAQTDYPSGTIEVIVPFPPGGGTDTVARLFIEPFSKHLGATVVPRNIGGASGSTGASAAARAEPDGYTLGYLPIGPASVQPSMRPGMYDGDSWAYICQTVLDPMILMVAETSPIKSAQELLQRDKLIYGSPGPGSTPHIAMAALTERAGITGTHIPYQGTGAAIAALAGGEIEVFADLAAVVGIHDVRPLAVFSTERHRDYPDLPTMAELGYEDMEFSVWHGLFAPAGLDPTIQQRLGEACEKAVQDEGFQSRVAKMTTTPAFRGPEEFEKFVRGQIDQNAALMRKVGLID